MLTDILKKNRFLNIKKYIKQNDKKYIKILKYLDDLIDNNISYPYRDEVLEELIYLLIEEAKVNRKKLRGEAIIEYLEEDLKVIYEIIGFNENDEKSLNCYYKLCSIYFKFCEKGIIHTTNYGLENIPIIYNSFNNKELVFGLFNEILNEQLINYYVLEDLSIYINESRKYYNDEIIYCNILKKMKQNFSKNSDKSYKKKIIEEQLSYDKRQANIYEIDDYKLNDLEKKLSDSNLKIEEINNQINSIVPQADSIKNEIDSKIGFAKEQLLSLKKQIINEILQQKKLINTSNIAQNNLNSLFDQIEQAKENIIEEILKYNPNFEYCEEIDWWILAQGDSFKLDYIANLTQEERKVFESFASQDYFYVLKELLEYNPNFLDTLNSLWPQYKDDVSILLFDQIDLQTLANLTNTQLYFILSNYEFQIVDDYFICLKINNKFEVYEDDIFDDNIINSLGYEIIAFADKELQETIIYFSEDIDTLKKILDVNMNFRVYLIKGKYLINDGIIASYGIDLIANSNADMQYTLYRFYINSSSQTLIDILNINPNFCLDSSKPSHYFEVLLYETCSPEEIIYLYENGLINKIRKLTTKNEEISFKAINQFTYLTFEEKQMLLEKNQPTDKDLQEIYNNSKLNKAKTKVLSLFKKNKG